MVVLFARLMRLKRGADEGGFVKDREDGVAFRFGLDLGDVQASGARQGGGEYGRAADDADLVHAVVGRLFAGDGQGFVQRRTDDGALGQARLGVGLILGQDDVQPSGQGA